MKARAACTRQTCLSRNVRSAFHQTARLSSRGCRRTDRSSSQLRNPTESAEISGLRSPWPRRASAPPQDAQREGGDAPPALRAHRPQRSRAQRREVGRSNGSREASPCSQRLRVSSWVRPHVKGRLSTKNGRRDSFRMHI